MKKKIMLTMVCLLAAIGWVTAQNSPIKVLFSRQTTTNRLSELPY